MRWSMLLLLVGSVGGAPALAGEAPSFPYKAYVNREEVNVRSGPGEEYYPTDKLKIGQEVEIYRHDPGGWFAIRPPEGSFSWVSARYLDLRKNRLAKVNSERVAARVGSRFSDVRDVIQVRLQKGEMVEILENLKAADGQGGQAAWCKISPPSGEFRWVLGKYVDPEYRQDGLGRPRSTERGESDQAAAAPPAVEELPRSTGRPSASWVLINPAPPIARQVGAEAGGVANDAPSAVRSPAVRHLSPEEYQDELDDIDLKLSVMLSTETSAWCFDDLRPRATVLLDQAQTAVERGRARLLTNKIARFEEIKQRYDTVNNVHRQVTRDNTALADLSQQRGAALPPPNPQDQYDGVGRLTRVVSVSPTGPRYALLDAKGQVRCYVSAAPGVNLQYYIGHEVGINGVQGQVPQDRSQHLMAKHVTVMDTTTLVR